MSRAAQNCLRIIAGQWRGRKLDFAKVDAIRPTPDRVRETLFNWLAPVIRNSHCLDLFAGSGALGFEALSRGAASVLMCDSNKLIINKLKQHASLLQTDAANFLQQDALEVLRQNKLKFDVIFLDPPFNTELLEECFSLITAGNCLNEEALIYVEASSRQTLPPLPTTWTLYRNKKAGDVAYYLFKTN